MFGYESIELYLQFHEIFVTYENKLIYFLYIFFGILSKNQPETDRVLPRLTIFALFSYSVYAPMSVRLIQYCSKPGWKSIIDSLDLLPGPSFEEYQNLSRNKNKLDTTKKLPQNNGTKRTLVVFVGGCTYAEISALRFLSQQVRCLKKYDQFAA